MRTKTLLIAAASALAATVISSQAQSNVYSANIVGYVNTVLTANPNYSLIVVPLGVTNSPAYADQVITCIQPGDAIFQWTGNAFNTAYYEPGDGEGADNNWVDGGFNPIAAPTVAAGGCVFFQNNFGANETNTFVGTCVLSNTVPLTANPNYSLVGSTPPVAGNADDPNSINLPLQPGDAVFLWGGNGFTTYYYEPGDGEGADDNWVDGGFNPENAPFLNVGQGFFYQNNFGANEAWTQVINVN